MANVPDLLSGLRLVLAPVLLALAWFGYPNAFLVCLVVSLFSDLADGFLARRYGQVSELGAKLDGRGNVQADTVNYQTSVDKVFAAGDMRRGQSLVVWAIREGRQCAREVDQFLMGESTLPR